MPAKTGQVPSAIKARGGRRTVTYRDALGRTKTGVIVGPGSSSGMKIRIGSRMGGFVRDNVPLATGPKQTNVYFNHRL